MKRQTQRERDLARLAEIRALDLKREATREARATAGNAAILQGTTDRAKAQRETTMERDQVRRAKAAANRRAARGKA